MFSKSCVWGPCVQRDWDSKHRIRTVTGDREHNPNDLYVVAVKTDTDGIVLHLPGSTLVSAYFFLDENGHDECVWNHSQQSNHKELWKLYISTFYYEYHYVISSPKSARLMKFPAILYIMY